MDKISALRSKIIEAFSSIPHPGKENVVEHQCEECDELKDTFGSLQAERVPPEVIDANFGQLPLFTPEAFKYFLPAYVLRCLDDFSAENLVCEFVIYALTPSNKGDRERKWYADRLALFSNEQREVMTEFLEYVISTEEFSDYHHDAISGLSKHWKLAN